MDSGMISQIEKARLYTNEPERITFNRFNVTIQGDHHDHTVNYIDGIWDCSCGDFAMYKICAHVMVLERWLEGSID